MAFLEARAIPGVEVESVAVGLLHAFVNPIHERRIGAILAEELPDVPVSLSSEVSPEMREWERFSTTVANAYVQAYLEPSIELRVDPVTVGPDLRLSLHSTSLLRSQVPSPTRVVRGAVPCFGEVHSFG